MIIIIKFQIFHSGKLLFQHLKGLSSKKIEKQLFFFLPRLAIG